MNTKLVVGGSIVGIIALFVLVIASYTVTAPEGEGTYSATTTSNEQEQVPATTATTTPTTPDSSSQQQASNEGISQGDYVLVSFNGVAPVDGATYVLTVEANRMGIRFCNGMGGDITYADSRVSGQFISTQMFCESPSDVMALEQAFGALLYAGASYAQDGTNLTLQGGATTFVFRQK